MLQRRLSNCKASGAWIIPEMTEYLSVVQREECQEKGWGGWQSGQEGSCAHVRPGADVSPVRAGMPGTSFELAWPHLPLGRGPEECRREGVAGGMKWSSEGRGGHFAVDVLNGHTEDLPGPGKLRPAQIVAGFMRGAGGWQEWALWSAVGPGKL